MKKSISLIIAFYNDVMFLEMIFEQLKKQTFKDFEVVIADDGSREDVVKRISQIKDEMPFPVQHVWHEDLGWRKDVILNKAVVASKADYLVFIDGDCIPHHKFLEEHWKYRKEGEVVAGRRVPLIKKISDSLTVEKVRNGILSKIVIPTLWAGVTEEESHVENIIRITSPWIRKVFLRQKVNGLLGCNFGMFKSDLLKVNGFDERYLIPATGEDTDLEARLNRIGIYCRVYKHVLTVYHKHHKRLETDATENIKLLQYNEEHNISYTPWGIVKQSDK